MLKNKCDVIIPVYNAPEWVKLCVYAVIKNTSLDYLNKIIIMNDNSNDQTLNCLNNLKEKYGDIIQLITNQNNLGFVKNCNKGFSFVESEYVLLLNSDCLVSSRTIEKLIHHMQKNEKIGLICPIASNAANLSLPMFNGFSYTQMNDLLESKFKGMSFDACTVVGNCLMIKSECLHTVGHLDEIYGMGYGEETDYQFQCMAKGYEAKVAIDTYVFHKAEVSFGKSEEKQKKLDKNREIFFSRWRKQYDELFTIYKKNDPIVYINEHLTEEDKKISLEEIVYLPTIIQNAGGSHVVIDMVNYLTINGKKCNVLYDLMKDYTEILLFSPIHSKKIKDINVDKIVATIWASVFKAKKIADEKNIPLIYFVQGYEPYFENGEQYGKIGLTYKLADSVLTISQYLKTKLNTVFKVPSQVIPNGVNYDLFFNSYYRKTSKSITLFLRGNVMKGDFLLLDLLKMLNDNLSGLTINVIYVNKKITFPYLKDNKNTINYIKGPIPKTKMNQILRATDIYVDCSLNEGFGLLALESIFAGAVPVVSNSFGIEEYMTQENGIIIDKVNDVKEYFNAVLSLLEDNELYLSKQKNRKQLAKKFDYDLTIEKIIDFFNEDIQKKDISLSQKEKIILKNSNLIHAQTPKISGKMQFMVKVWHKLPNRIKSIIYKISRAFVFLEDECD